MNKPSPERELVEQALAAMTPHGLRSHVVGAGSIKDKARPAPIIEIGRDGEMVKYMVEVRRQVNAANVGPVIHDLLGGPANALLVTTYVTPPVATQLHDQGVQFIDAAGNASLSNRAFMVWVKGEKQLQGMVARHAVKEEPFTVSGRAFQPRGLQVVFTLLCDPQRINKPFRELARMSGVANGTVASVVADLEQEGFVRKLNTGHGSRRMFDLKELLRQWTDAYARTLRPRTLLARYYASGAEDWTKWSLGGEALWGSETAGALMTRHLTPGELTVYAEKMPMQLVARQHLLKAAEPGHAKPVEFRRRFWNFASEASPETLHATVPALLAYADLLAVGDARCLETATMIYEDRIARLIDQ